MTDFALKLVRNEIKIFLEHASIHELLEMLKLPIRQIVRNQKAQLLNFQTLFLHLLLRWMRSTVTAQRLPIRAPRHVYEKQKTTYKGDSKRRILKRRRSCRV